MNEGIISRSQQDHAYSILDVFIILYSSTFTRPVVHAWLHMSVSLELERSNHCTGG